jgi:hypothetical protein
MGSLHPNWSEDDVKRIFWHSFGNFFFKGLLILKGLQVEVKIIFNRTTGQS